MQFYPPKAFHVALSVLSVMRDWRQPEQCEVEVLRQVSSRGFKPVVIGFGP